MAPGSGTGAAAVLSHASLDDLARALVTSEIWETIPRAVMVVRQHPTPVLAVLGYVDDAQTARIEALPDYLTRRLRRLHPVDPESVVAAVEELASALVDRFGRDGIEGMQFTAVPRGGLIVLGLLAYALDLRPDQLPGPASAAEATAPASLGEESRLVVVDDCAISGERFHRVLCDLPGAGPVVFAHLYSHPELRAGIEAAESRVEACVAARDLVDHAPDDEGDGYEAWRRRWSERPGARYWVGATGAVVFPWNEPDANLWNPVTGEAEPGWRVVPPATNLKNRWRRVGGGDRLWVQPDAPGPIRPADEVVWAPFGDEVLVADLAAGRVAALDAAGVDFWRALLEHGRFDPAVAELCAGYDAPPDVLGPDLVEFAGELAEAGLLIVPDEVRP